MKTPEYWQQAAEEMGGFDTIDAALDHIKAIQLDARREGMKDAAKILEKLPCIRHDGKQSSEYIKAGLRDGYKAIMAAMPNEKS